MPEWSEYREDLFFRVRDTLDAEVVARAELCVFEGAVGACGVETEIFRHGGLFVVRQVGKVMARKAQNVHEIIRQGLAEITGEFVVKEIDVEIHVMPDEDVLAEEVAEFAEDIRARTCRAHHRVGDARQLCDEERDGQRRFDELGILRGELVPAEAQRGHLDDLRTLAGHPRRLDVDDGIIIRKIE